MYSQMTCDGHVNILCRRYCALQCFLMHISNTAPICDRGLYTSNCIQRRLSGHLGHPLA